MGVEVQTAATGENCEPEQAIAKHIRKQAATHRENPRSPITKAVLALHSRKPELDDSGIARTLNSSGKFERDVTRNNVKRIRHSYEHLW